MIHVRFHQKAIVLNAEGKILALRASYKGKKWDLLGGAVELPELHEVALRRECREEAGIEISAIRPVDVQTGVVDGDGSYSLFIGYICRTIDEQIQLSDEHEEFKWVTKNEFLELDVTGYLKDFVRSYYAT